jgi:hypothetical protein
MHSDAQISLDRDIKGDSPPAHYEEYDLDSETDRVPFQPEIAPW